MARVLMKPHRTRVLPIPARPSGRTVQNSTSSTPIAMVIVQAQQAVTSYYILGYYTTKPALDGKYRKVKVTLAGDTSAKLDYRVGYYAGKTFSKFTSADKERQLEDALMQGDPITE